MVFDQHIQVSNFVREGYCEMSWMKRRHDYYVKQIRNIENAVIVKLSGYFQLKAALICEKYITGKSVCLYETGRAFYKLFIM
jgi:hypothetical protein